jgi:hypothetical protein
MHATSSFRGELTLPPFGTFILFQPDELALAEAVIGGLLQLDLTDESRHALQIVYDQVRSPYDKSEVN